MKINGKKNIERLLCHLNKLSKLCMAVEKKQQAQF